MIQVLRDDLCIYDNKVPLRNLTQYSMTFIGNVGKVHNCFDMQNLFMIFSVIEGGDKIRKIIIFSFEGDEDKIVDALKMALNLGSEKLTIQKLEWNDCMQFNNLKINFERREVTKYGKRIELTYTEFEIIQLLIQHPGKVFSKEQIYNFVWNEPYLGDGNIIMSHIRNIRKKIEDDTSHPTYIQNVWGVGYKFNDRMGSDG